MNIVKTYSRKALISICLFMAILALLVDVAFYLGMNTIFSNLTITSTAQGGVTQMVGLINKISFLQNVFKLYFVPISSAVFAVFAIFMWICLKSTLNKLYKNQETARQPKKGDQAARAEELRIQKEKEKRYFIHLLSVFQREGRLVDFFYEDLGLYEDVQIGAAVRSIHESCRKTMQKYLSPKSVIDHNEGDEVTVPEGFNPSTIKLTGNVTGEPPFTGILRHRGWKAEKTDLPTLSDAEDPMILAPAEVEIS